MLSAQYDIDDDIQALASPPGESALALIRISGPSCYERFKTVFSKPAECRKENGGKHIMGCIVDGDKNIDQAVVLFYAGPVSYTGQDMIEISCHGNMAGVAEIQNLLRGKGIRNAEPGEFTFRAFINRKLDLTQAEAVQEIIKSRSAKAHHLALDRLSGSIRKFVTGIREALMDIVSSVELQLDYPDDELGTQARPPLDDLVKTREDLTGLLKTYRSGKIFRDGIRVVLAGKTNSGKSSLFNLFLKEDRAIVSDVHGTTRDFLEAWITVNGVPVTMYDTAGLRAAENPIEQEGIRRSKQKIDEGHIILYIIDGEKGYDAEDEAQLSVYGDSGRVIRVWNKCDLKSPPPDMELTAISAITVEGFAELEQKLYTTALGTLAGNEELILDSERQKLLFEECLEYVNHAIEGTKADVPLDALSMDLRGALDALGRISGETSSTDILEHLFSRFCVGK
ncbi:MAG: tRNA uridine-5-carboxymethylaminomethyl(34) synthesis GTPase MnmE [Spirochaetales bacterium]|nr:tRNA uridine-5-carboxymethylaminomethyl(34) synthesis GTPase MnmE [Spirochaetales bacterium]